VTEALNVARGVWWRQAHIFFTNPSFLLPSLLFPLLWLGNRLGTGDCLIMRARRA